jgi:pullulanase
MEVKILAALFAAALSVPLLFAGAPASAGETGKNAGGITRPDETAKNSAPAAAAFKLHYHRPDGDYDGWKIWSWGLPESANLEINRAGVDEFGAVFFIDAANYKNAGQIGILPKYKEWEKKDDPNRFIEISGIINDGIKDIYIVSGKKETFTQKPDISPFIKAAFLDSETEITAVLSKKISADGTSLLNVRVLQSVQPENHDKNLAISHIALLDDNGGVLEAKTGGAKEKDTHARGGGEAERKDETPASNIVKIKLADHIKYDFSGAPPVIKVEIEGFAAAQLKPRNILYSKNFQYDGELGCLYGAEASVFKTFAPAAQRCELIIYDSHDAPQSQTHEMARESGGVWSVKAAGDLINKYYKYAVTIDGERREALDPYSKCNTAHNGRAIIIDDKTPIADPPVFTIDKAVIYEMHIRDFTIDEKTTVKNRGKFLGAAEENTTHSENTEVKTGIDHLKELGVNTVQILPIQDFENDEKSDAYNWGYMPVNFNSPDGWYASDTVDSSRVVECKKMIDAFHRNGIKVVIDVVYNHTAEGNEMVRHSFNALAPNYYYRLKANGEYWNGSGCGNEFKSESYMGRKFIIDSLKYWVREYKIDGFRFDLMGLMDTETIYLLTSELKKMNPDIFIYGEPWAAGAAGIEPSVKGVQRGKGFAVFNDIFRDAIKGSVWDDKGGYVQGTRGVELIERGVIGSILDFALSPLESINYCEAHDNLTLYDTLIHTTAYDKSITAEKIIKMHKLACFLTLTSQGVPFLHAGQEMMRSKDGEENSYNKPDSINKIYWDLKIENAGMVNFVKELISLRMAHPMFRMKSAEEIYANLKFLSRDLQIPVAPKCLAYLIERGATGDSWKAALVLVNPRRDTIKFILPEDKWKLYYHNDGFNPQAPAGGITSEIELSPVSASILYRD